MKASKSNQAIYDSVNRPLTNADILASVKQLQAMDAAESMKDFTAYTKPDYDFDWFNELVCLELDQFLVDVEAGKIPLLMLFAPPRSGKTELASRRFPSYALGKFPDWNIISTSYSSDLANKNSRDVQRIILDPLYHDVFPDVTLNGTHVRTAAAGAIRTVELWETINQAGGLHGGAYRAAGVNGGITGQGMNIGIVDDPAKDYKEASSKVYQENVIDWFDTTFSTRVDPNMHGMIIMLTRWHKNDLAGQLLKRMQEGGQAWRVISFPMEATEDEFHELNGKKYHTRKPGEILMPSRFPRKFVDQRKASGSLTWDALYQQNPTTKGGNLIKSEWFGEYSILPKLQWSAVFGDTAQKKGEENDFTVFEHWGLGEDGFLYLIDLLRLKCDADELKKRARAFWFKADDLKNGKCRFMGIEDKSSGTGLIQQIKKGDKTLEADDRRGVIPVRAIPRSDGKLVRLMDVQGYIESEYIKLPREAVWLNDFLTECEGITAKFNTHDDQIDPMMDAIENMIGDKKRAGFFS